MTDTTTEAVERLAEVAATFHATKQPKFEAGDNYKSAVFKMGFRSGYAAILAERDAARQDRDEAMAFAHATARYAKDRADAIAAFYDDENIPTQIVRDIIRALPAYEVAVRELEWVEIRPECYFESRAIGILYSVRLGTDGIARWQAGHMATWHDADSLEAAKAAAQADYDARIQSALIVTHTGIAASQTPDPVTNADSRQPTRAPASVKEAAKVLLGDDEACLRLAEAYDREDGAQRGEPSPHALGRDDPDYAEWAQDRVGCAKAALRAIAEGGEA